MLLLTPISARSNEAYSFEYTDNPRLSDNDFAAFTMSIAPTSEIIGCAVFRKNIAAGDGVWISLQLLRNHILMVITPNLDKTPIASTVPLLLGSTKISRLKRTGHLTTYYLLSEDVDQITSGKSLTTPGSKPVILLKSQEFNRMSKYLSCFP